MKNSITSTVQQKVAEMPLTAPFKPSAFVDVGSRAAIDMVLTRMVKSGALVRVCRGVYMRPKPSQFGVSAYVYPSVLDIVKVVCASASEDFEISGASAANRLGFSTQVPMCLVFNTTGSSRKLRLGKQVVELRHTSARKMILAGRPAGHALAALWYLGRHEVTPLTYNKIARLLPPEEFVALRQAKAYMPWWMLAALAEYEQVNKLEPVG